MGGALSQGEFVSQIEGSYVNINSSSDMGTIVGMIRKTEDGNIKWSSEKHETFKEVYFQDNVGTNVDDAETIKVNFRSSVGVVLSFIVNIT